MSVMVRHLHSSASRFSRAMFCWMHSLFRFLAVRIFIIVQVPVDRCGTMLIKRIKQSVSLPNQLFVLLLGDGTGQRLVRRVGGFFFLLCVVGSIQVIDHASTRYPWRRMGRMSVTAYMVVFLFAFH